MKNSLSSEIVNLASTSPKETLALGQRLAQTLHKKPVTIWLSGELGAGKTTFVKGLGLGLPTSSAFGGLRGASGPEIEITSPTYALENRYGDVLLHADLYRLDPEEAKRVTEESEDFPGVRVIEWSERIEGTEETEGTKGTEVKQKRTLAPSVPSVPSVPSIHIAFEETSKTERILTITFSDLALPDRTHIEEWRTDVKLPEHIGKHCDAVGKLGKELSEELLKRGTVCRPEVVRTAGELHDLLRFVDFTPESQSKIPHALQSDEDTRKHWNVIIEKYAGGSLGDKAVIPNSRHEAACAQFLEEHDFLELAEIIRPHGLSFLDTGEDFQTIEQKILFYADKRIKFDTVVSLDERFDDFAVRYGNGEESEQAKEWRRKTKELEKELFGEATPQ